METKTYECTCRYCGATYTRQRPTSTICDNIICRKRAKAESDKRYQQTENGKAVKKRISQSEKCKATRKRYEQTEVYKKSKSERAKKYKQNPHTVELDKVRKLRYYYRKYAVNKIEGADFISLEDWKSLYSATNCYYCGKPFDKNRNKTIDHKTPVRKGGTNALENLCTCCQSCNSKKGNMTESEFRQVLTIKQ